LADDSRPAQHARRDGRDEPVKESSKEPMSTNLIEAPVTEAERDSAVPTADHSNQHTEQRFPELSSELEKELVQVFKLLSDETRLRILVYLTREGELHVTALCDRLGQSQPAVSHHLALLRVSGLIESRREGKHNFYSVRTDHFGELLVNLFSATGEMPKKVRFHDFVLSYSG